MKNLKIFLLFGKYAIKTTVQHPLGGIVFLAGKLLRFGMYFLFVYYLLQHTRYLAGYNLEQTIIFFLTFNVVDTFAQLLFREVYRFRPLIVNGEFDTVLIKPFHPFLRVLVGGVDLLDLVTLVLYGGLLTYFLSYVEIAPLSLSLYLILILNAFVIATAFHIMALAVAIFTTEIDQFIMIYRDVTRMGTLPIDIYKEPLRSIVTFIIPVGVMMTFPAKALFGLLSWQMIFFACIVSAVFLIFSLYLWNRALMKYQSWGG